jgi:hypothetical protein
MGSSVSVAYVKGMRWAPDGFEMLDSPLLPGSLDENRHVLFNVLPHAIPAIDPNSVIINSTHLSRALVPTVEYYRRIYSPRTTS